MSRAVRVRRFSSCQVVCACADPVLVEDQATGGDQGQVRRADPDVGTHEPRADAHRPGA